MHAYQIQWYGPFRWYGTEDDYFFNAMAIQQKVIAQTKVKEYGLYCENKDHIHNWWAVLSGSSLTKEFQRRVISLFRQKGRAFYWRKNTLNT